MEDDECELGYWLGKTFWGRGLMPEAVREMLRHAFEDVDVPLMHETRTGYVNAMTREEWENVRKS